MATKKTRNRMYEPWGYREQNKLDSNVAGQWYSDIYFADVKYKSDKNKIYFYNEFGEEVGTIDVNEFKYPIPSIDSTSFDPSTNILTITFKNGNVVDINIEGVVNHIQGAIDDETNRATTAEENILNLVEQAIDNELILQQALNEVKDAAFANIEYEWKEDEKKMALNLYNMNNELKDSADMFDTNEIGDILLEAGDF